MEDGELVLNGKNKEDLFCTVCSSKILLSNTGTFIKCEMWDGPTGNRCSLCGARCWNRIGHELPKMTQRKGATEVKTDLITECFQLKDVLQFENVGSTKPVDNIKYLACADCELGPIGWQGSQGSSCFVALTRVRHGNVKVESSEVVDENAN